MDWVIEKNDGGISDGSGNLGNDWDWKPDDAYLSVGAVTSNITDMLTYAKMQLDFYTTMPCEISRYRKK